LHGDEPAEWVRRLGPRAFKAVRPQTLAEAASLAASYAPVGPASDDLPQLLADAYHRQRFGGTGLPVDLSIARALAARFRLLLAGGLTPESVGEVIERVRPWGVDVSSGVERAKGLKDWAKVWAFVRAAREASTSTTR
jgi:phosphoribosylanthranilate isomerase